jgi:D-tyrosyl-tRNA(Tyr) deacylase
VSVDGEVVGAIDHGILVYVAVGHGDTKSDIDYVAGKVVNLRIFPDSEGKMNLSLLDLLAAQQTGAASETMPGILVVSQFTLYGDVRKGRRPSYNDAAPPERAVLSYEGFLAAIEVFGVKPEHGVFQEHMDVTYTNDGPVTILVDSSSK